ncbi:MAG: ABC transporter permease [Alphaproteobacteria bacterium]
MTTDLLLRLRYNSGPLFALAVFLAMFIVFLSLHPRGLSVYVMTTAGNQGFGLALVAMAQTVAVLTAGLDLSVGSVLALSNCLASALVSGSPGEIVLGIVLVLLCGAGCGLLNGLIIVFGRIQPLIATLATGAVYLGLALVIRPIPGGSVDEALSEALTYETFGVVPTSLLILLGIVLLVWLPYKNSKLGRGAYAVGTSEQAALLSGVRVGRAKIAAYTLSGVFAATGGLYISFQTLSGDALIGPSYTLNSIAAVVIGGTSLFGGVGGVVGSIFGAYILRTINGLLFFAAVPPLAQPLFEGIVLLVAVGLGALRVLKIRNRLELLA